MKFLEPDEINKALQKAASRGERDYLITNILAKSGIRVSELISITPNDILNHGGQLIIRGKGNKIRNVDIPQDLILQMRIYIKNRKIKPNKPIINLTTRRVYDITKDVAGIGPHTFRHSYAIALLKRTKNIRYVQVQLGHSTLSTTQVYLRYMDFDEEKEKLGGLYKN